MKKYIVKSAKPVTVRLGTQARSKVVVKAAGERFETSPEFVQDLVTLGYVEEVSAAAKEPPATKNTKAGDK